MNNCRYMLVLTVSALGLMTATSARSQGTGAMDVAPNPDTTTPGNAPAATSAESGQPGDIVVTARKRNERAQDIPVSITVQNDRLLRERSITNFTELGRATPSLVINPSLYSPATTQLAMRGQALVDIRLFIDPTVGIYQDGVYLPRAQGSTASDLFDVDRVEVLAGPQGTLYGKNTTGGLLSIYTKTPVDRLEGEARARYGSFGEYQVNGVINLPLTPTLATRLVVAKLGRSGIGTNLTTGNRLGKLDGVSIRDALQWTPNDTVKIVVRGDFTRLKAGGLAFHGFETAKVPTTPATCPTPAICAAPAGIYEAALELNNLTTTQFAAQPLATRQTQLDAARLAVLGSTAQGNSAALNLDPFDRIRVWGASATLDWTLGETTSIKSITALRGFNRRGAVDIDGTPFHIFEYPETATRDQQFSEELQLAGSAFDNRLQWITGGYYSNEHGNELVVQRTVPLITNAGPSNPLAIQRQLTDVRNRSAGLFAQGSYKILSNLSVTAGFRYSWDTRYVGATVYNVDAAGLGTCATQALPIVSAVVSGGLGITSIAQCERPQHASFQKPSWTVSADYHITPDVMFYLKSSRGYRSGGLQGNAGVSPASNCNTATGSAPGSACLNNIALVNTSYSSYRPEIITDYEVGVKSQLFDHSLTLNLTYFHSDLRDAIRSVAITIVGSSAIATRAQNAASVKIDGVEWQANWRPATWLDLYTSGSWLHARFNSYVTPAGRDLTLLPVLFTPKWQYSVGGSVTQPLPFGSLRTSLDWAYTAKFLAGEELAYTRAQGQLNARMTLAIAHANVDVALFGKNLTNKRYFTYPADISSLVGVVNNAINLPRRFGVEIAKRF